MSSKNRKPKRASRLPAIVPRFLKTAVTIGAIPALVGCEKGHQTRMQPVVAQYVEPAPVVAAYTPDAAPPTPIQPPVVAAVVLQPPVVAAMMPHPLQKPPADAGVDAAPPKKPTKNVKPPPRPPDLGVAAMFAPPNLGDQLPPPPVVAAMLPDQNLIGPKTPPKQPPKKTKKP